jgi:hypothetical protein
VLLINLASYLVLERFCEIPGADSLAGGVRDQCANEAMRMSRFFLVLQATGKLAYERSGSVSHSDEAFDLQIAVRFHDRGGVHAKFCCESADGG